MQPLFMCQQNLVNNLVTLYIPMWVMLKGFRVRMIGEKGKDALK